MMKSRHEKKVWLVRAVICGLCIAAIALSAAFPILNWREYSGALDDTILSGKGEEEKRLYSFYGGVAFFTVMLFLGVRVIRQAFRSSKPWDLFQRD